MNPYDDIREHLQFAHDMLMSASVLSEGLSKNLTAIISEAAQKTGEALRESENLSTVWEES